MGWSEQAPDFIIIPPDGQALQDAPYIVIGSGVSTFGNNYASINFFSPTSMPAWYAFKNAIFASGLFTVYQLGVFDTTTDLPVAQFMEAVYDNSDDTTDLTLSANDVRMEGTGATSRIWLSVESTGDGNPNRNLILESDFLDISSYSGNGVNIEVDFRDIGAFNIGNVQDTTAGATTTSATFAAISGLSAATVDKNSDFNGLRIDFHITSFSTAIATVAEFGVQISGVDYMVCRMVYNVANSHVQASGTLVTTAPDAGFPLTVTPIWRRVSGAGTVTLDTNDLFSMTVSEVSG